MSWIELQNYFFRIKVLGYNNTKAYLHQREITFGATLVENQAESPSNRSELIDASGSLTESASAKHII